MFEKPFLTVSKVKARKTVETVFAAAFASSTGLKPGVNEKDSGGNAA